VISAGIIDARVRSTGDGDMHHEMVELRGRLRAVNIEHRRLLRQSTSEGWFARMAVLRSERRELMAQIAVLQPDQIAVAGAHVPQDAVNQPAAP
jgi:hypothetical protein